MTIDLGLYLYLHHLESELLLAKEMMEQVGMLGKKLLLSMLLALLLLMDRLNHLDHLLHQR